MPLSNDIKLQEIAIATQNYTGADLAALCREAAISAMRNKSSKINSREFAVSLKQIKPSITKEVDQWYNTIREIFRKAKASSPCVIIFDELDALAKSKSGEGGAGETILSQLLTEIEEGTSSRVAVIGITNRPDIIDNSLLRTGRLDLVLYVTPPDEKSRLEII